MNTDYFKYLSTVAECHSIRQAAEKLHLKQQYLGTIVKNIETHYDITIFNRTHRGITLTKDGQFFLERAQQINQLLQELESPYLYPSKQEYSYIVKDITIYMLNLATPGQFINIIDAFHNHFPYININIFVKNHKELVELVEEDPNAIGLLYISEKNTPQHQLLPEILQVTPFGRGRLSAITSQYNKEAHHLTSISFYDFLQKQLVLYSAEEMDDNVVYQLLSEYGTPNVKYMVNSSSFLIELLREKNYWTIGKVEHTKQNELISIPFQEDITLQTYFVYNKEAAESFLIQSFIKIATNMLDSFNEPYLIK